MNQTLKRVLSGAVYVAIMWFGTKSSIVSFHTLFSFIFFISIYEMWKLRKGKTKALAYLYILIPLTLIHTIGQKEILLMFVLTWTFDTFAYLVGVKFGKHKIMPSVSPKKSWEGLAGGFVFTIIAAYFYQMFFNIALREILFISLVLPFTATLGDFIESHYKREAGVKNSGNFIPGHGGMLDRMDAFMITIPTIYILINFL